MTIIFNKDLEFNKLMGIDSPQQREEDDEETRKINIKYWKGKPVISADKWIQIAGLTIFYFL